MRLVTFRSDLRCVPFFLLYVAIGSGAIIVEPLWARLVLSCGSAIGLGAAAAYVFRVRRWTREGDELLAPTFREPQRQFIVPRNEALELLDMGFGRMLWIGDMDNRARRKIAINMCVSSRDLKRWIAPPS